MSVPLISNAKARRIFLQRHALAEAPTGSAKGEDLCALIRRLGFVQVDSINTIARAHDMILYSRRKAYRPKNLATPLEKDRTLFEHWTHDASVIPVEYFPHWRLHFDRRREYLRERWRDWRPNGFEDKFDEVLKQIADHGACCSSDVGEDEKRSSGGWWEWHPSKTALEYLWRTGALTVTRREGDRLIGRIDMKCDRSKGALNVRAFWPEKGAKPGAGRLKRLQSEIERIARFTDCRDINFAADWLRG